VPMKYEGIFEDWEKAVANNIVNQQWEKWPGLRRAGKDFLLRDCLDHWHSRRETYQEGKGATIKSYMGIVLRNYLASYLRKELAKKRKALNSADSLDRPLNPENPAVTLGATLPDSRRHDPRFLLDLETSRARLTPRQREICDLLSYQTSKTKIAGALNLSRDTIYEEIRRIREIFRRDGLEEYP